MGIGMFILIIDLGQIEQYRVVLALVSSLPSTVLFEDKSRQNDKMGHGRGGD